MSPPTSIVPRQLAQSYSRLLRVVAVELALGHADSVKHSDHLAKPFRGGFLFCIQAVRGAKCYIVVSCNVNV